MANIGILTYHNNENRGAILQAYCLREVISDIFECNPNVIEYRTASKERERRNRTYIKKDVFSIPSRIRGRQITESFIDSKLHPSSGNITTDDHSKAVEWLEKENYDMIISGSDEVWKIPESSTDFRSKLFPSRPFPNLYFLDPTISALKVAYAASANTVDPTKLTPFQRKTFQSHIHSFDHISVRDSHTETLLKNIGVTDVHRVPDPTLLCDIPAVDTDSILKQEGLSSESKLLGLHTSRSSVFDPICDYYRKRGYQVISMTESPYADINLRGKVGPLEYYSLYDTFDMVVTSSLHSTIFSLKHKTPFVTVDVDDVYATIESKTQSLLREFGLLNRHFDAIDGDIRGILTQGERLERELQKTHIDHRIEGLREQGYKFLNTVKSGYEADD